MKASVWGYWLIVMGIFILVVMMLIQSYTTTNTQDYYLVKEVTNNALVDAVDYAHYRQTGELKINREKFMENFIRRFAETVTLKKEYKIGFYEIYEAPPKVSVRVTSTSDTFTVAGDAASFDVINQIDAILEMTVTDNNYPELP